ncbi:prepilin-type N-terminal cleavage/methylation domain-containing protein [Haloferula sp.]|uniref:prepilin-type N-terminal cleavage/methylation domain-containing protein n=1 Tax=Haloferula sp. TaxID=2497595 RepID=UPI00329C06F4
MTNPPSRKSLGFTLTELLVVIVIIVVLAAIGFGVGSRVMKSARAASSMNNLRQCGIAVHTIRDEGLEIKGLIPKGFFPPYGGFLGPPTWRPFCIYDLIGEQAGFCVGDGKRYVWSTHPSETFLQNPLSEYKIAEGKELGDVNLAPAGNRVQRQGGFGYNHLLNGWTHANSTLGKGQYKRTKLNVIRHPEYTIMMGEEQKDKPGNIIGPLNQAPHGPYKDGAHVMFVDGHVEHLKNDYLRSEEAAEKHFRLPGIR